MKVLNKLVRLMKQNRLLIVVGMFYLIAYVLKPDFIITAFDNSKYYIIEMAKIMPIIFVITIGIEAFVPKKTIEDNLGEGSALKGIFFSLLLGSLSAGPIYAAFPVCKTC